MKGLWGAIAVAGAWAAFAGMSDVTIWGLLETYLKPLLGSITVGGVIIMAKNYISIKKAIADGKANQE